MVEFSISHTGMLTVIQLHAAQYLCWKWSYVKWMYVQAKPIFAYVEKDVSLFDEMWVILSERKLGILRRECRVDTWDGTKTNATSYLQHLRLNINHSRFYISIGNVCAWHRGVAIQSFWHTFVGVVALIKSLKSGHWIFKNLSSNI